MHKAASGGHETLLGILMENVVDDYAQGGLQQSRDSGANALNERRRRQLAGWTLRQCFARAAFGGHETVAQILLENGADVSAQGELYGSALKAAAEGGHDRVVKLLSTMSE